MKSFHIGCKSRSPSPIKNDLQTRPTLQRGESDSTYSDENDRNSETELHDGVESRRKHPSEAKKEQYVKSKIPQFMDSETKSNTQINALIYDTSSSTSQEDLEKKSALEFANDKKPTSPMSDLGNTRGPKSNYFASKLGVGSASSPSASGLRIDKMTPRPVRPQALKRGVSFDTCSSENRQQSLTLKRKHPDFHFRRNNKTFLAGLKYTENSMRALEWVIEEMAVDGDTVVVLHVLHEKAYSYIDKKQAAREMKMLESLNKSGKKISIIYEVAIGRPRLLLKLAIEEYSPSMMVIGSSQNEGKSNFFYNFTHGSLSRPSFRQYFLEYGTVPLIIVKLNYHLHEPLLTSINSPYYFQECLKNIDTNAIH